MQCFGGEAYSNVPEPVCPSSARLAQICFAAKKGAGHTISWPKYKGSSAQVGPEFRMAPAPDFEPVTLPLGEAP